MDATSIVQFSFGPIVKAAALLFLGLYIVFSTIVVKQVNLMTETLEVGFETTVRVIAYFHLALSFAVFFLALFIL